MSAAPEKVRRGAAIAGRGVRGKSQTRLRPLTNGAGRDSGRVERNGRGHCGVAARDGQPFISAGAGAISRTLSAKKTAGAGPRAVAGSARGRAARAGLSAQTRTSVGEASEEIGPAGG